MFYSKTSCIHRFIFLFLICFLTHSYNPLKAQTLFAERCIGKWQGIMYIYGKGQLKDSVPVELLVEKTATPNTWTWKTSYLSKTMPAVKDYKLILKDSATQTYVTDENDGIELMDYHFINKLYSIFETHDVVLTSSYELQGNYLTFEVTSGKKLDGMKEVTNYSVQNLQRVVFKKVQ